jgi:2,4-dienoyl-CoA reductase-like NADH-dependent reductase (Old Yellow Enzyme family)
MVYPTSNKDLSNAFKERRLGEGKTILKNCFIKSATFEGMYKNGLPTSALTDHHVAMAHGEVALTTVSYGAVSPEARTFNNQMYINKESLKQLRVLADEVHKADGKVSMQLTHCGYFSKNKDFKKPLAPSCVFNEYGFLSGIVFSRQWISRICRK